MYNDYEEKECECYVINIINTGGGGVVVVAVVVVVRKV